MSLARVLAAYPVAADRTPAEMGTLWVDSREARESTAVRKDGIETEIAGRFVTISPY